MTDVIYIDADQARNSYKDPTYLESLDQVMKAINEACEAQHRVVVNVPTGIRQHDVNTAYHVMKFLCRKGYDVVMCHDSENGSSELTVSWE